MKKKNDRVNKSEIKMIKTHLRLSGRIGRKDIEIIDVKEERRINKIYQKIKQHPSTSKEEISVSIDKENIVDEKPSISAEIAQEEANIKKDKKKKKNKKERRLTKSGRPKSRWYSIFFATIIWLIVICGLVGTVGVSYVAYQMYLTKPAFSAEKLEAPDSTIVYDVNGNVIQEIGEYKRENITYAELPNVLVDAFLSIEDARYFEHFGFDIPRFSKAILENLRTMSFGQGGSTFTMQLIKNSYFQIDAGEDSTIAESSIVRKAQEIMLAIEADYKMPKEDILIDYLNRINFGNNIRGIEKAAQYYFGKDASDLNLPESAFLAGIINSPNSYNPYNELIKNDPNSMYTSQAVEYLNNGTKRRNEVLDMMLYHGYISEAELLAAKTVKLEDQLVGVGDEWANKAEYFQGYIDAVIEEVIAKTGLNPYYTSMKIYTNMDPYVQQVVYDIQNDNTSIDVDRGLMQTAIAIMNNQTGELVALGGGRDEGGARQWNRATMSRFQPGSTVKPVLDYLLAFETLGWATTHVLTDKPIYFYNGDKLVSNFNNRYWGDITLQTALGDSSNTCAIQALEAVINAKDEQYVIDYLNSVGVPTTADDFDIQYAIGSNRFAVSPVQLAAMHAVLMNGGKYIEPHTVNRIEFADEEKEDYVADTVGNQVISPGAAFMSATLCYSNVYGPFYNLMQGLRTGYPVYAKTGTTDWSDDGLSYGIPLGAIKDSWLVCQTSQYTNAIWTGFDRLERGSYFPYEPNVKGQIGRYLLDIEKDHFGYEPTYVSQPDDVSRITHTSGVYPYVNDAGNYVTGYILDKFYGTTSINNVKVPPKTKVFKGVSATLDKNFGLNIEFNLSGPQADGSVDCTHDFSAKNYRGHVTYAKGPCIYSGGPWVDPVAKYTAEIWVGGELKETIEVDTLTATVDLSKYTTLELPKPIIPPVEDIIESLKPSKPDKDKPSDKDPNKPNDGENEKPKPNPIPKPEPIRVLKGDVEIVAWYSLNPKEKITITVAKP